MLKYKENNLESIVWRQVTPKLYRYAIKENVEKAKRVKKLFVLFKFTILQIFTYLNYKFEKTSIVKLMLPIAWFFLEIWLFLIYSIFSGLI